MVLEIDLKPTSKKLKQFGGIACLALLLIAGWIYWQGSIFWTELSPQARSLTPPILATLGILSGLFSLVAPLANRPLYVALTLLSFPIGFVLSHVLLALIFYGLLTPVGLFFRIVGRDPLERRFDPEATSYWTNYTRVKDKKSYFSQF